MKAKVPSRSDKFLPKTCLIPNPNRTESINIKVIHVRLSNHYRFVAASSVMFINRTSMS